MSMHVIGFKPADEKWKKMKDAYDSCIQADVEIPESVEDFFEDGEPDNAGVKVKIKGHPCYKEWTADATDGFDIDITKLPADVKIIRVSNSY